MSQKIRAEIFRAAQEVFRELGPNHSEKTYQNALKIELGEPRACSEEVMPIHYKKSYVGFQRVDLTWQGIVIEIKCVSKTGPREIGQCQRYARSMRKDVVLLNFGGDVVFMDFYPSPVN